MNGPARITLKLIKRYLPTKQEFYQNPVGWISAAWVVSVAITAILIPRATVINLALLGLSVLAISVGKKRLPSFPAHPFVAILAFILILAGSSYFWSIAPAETLRRLPRLGLLFLCGLLALAAVQQATPKIANKAMTLATVAFSIAVAVIAIEINFNYILYRTFISLFTQTTQSTYVGGNVINQPALLIALYLWPVSLALWLKGYRIISIIFIALALVIFTQSRSESVGLALVCGTLACGLAAMKPRLMKIWFSLAIICLMLAMPFIPQLLQSLLQGYEKQIALSGLHRLEIWNFTIDRILEHPLLGHGLEASRIFEGSHTSEFSVLSRIIPGASRLPLHPHNGFLQIWLELGVAGYGVLGLLCLWIVHKISQLKGASLAFSTGLFVCGLSLFSTAFGMWQSWIIAVEFSCAGALLLTLKLGDKSLQNDT